MPNDMPRRWKRYIDKDFPFIAWKYGDVSQGLQRLGKYTSADGYRNVGPTTVEKALKSLIHNDQVLWWIKTKGLPEDTAEKIMKIFPKAVMLD